MLKNLLASLSRSRAVRVVAVVVGVTGIVLSKLAYSSWQEYRSYTVAVEATVSQRTDTFAAVRFLLGGKTYLELPYSAISGTRSDIPPANGPPFALGDKVHLLHPPLQASSAKLPEAVAPAVPPWLGWTGLAGVVLSAFVLTTSIVLSRSMLETRPTELGATTANVA